MSIDELRKQMRELDEYINSLTVWDDHAEYMQSEYDQMLALYNKMTGW